MLIDHLVQIPPGAVVPLSLLASLCVIWLSRRVFGRTTSSNPLPPGPKGWPVIGNLFDMPTSQEHLTFAKWKKDYGNS
jgi:hypothetical protein